MFKAQFGMGFDWVDTPALIRGAERVYEYPMVDRDPIETWTDGCVTLIGDAAHATYPVGSSGGSQAVIDARKLGRAFLDQGVNVGALGQYEAEVLPVANKVIETNRGSGPDAFFSWSKTGAAGSLTTSTMLFRTQNSRRMRKNTNVSPGLRSKRSTRRRPLSARTNE